MVEIDMNKEPESGFLLGTNLWEVREVKADKSRSSGVAMLRITLKHHSEAGEYELKDIAMLGGKGWGIGKKKLLALGVDPSFSGSLDTFDLIGRKVWVATVLGKFEGLDRKTGEKKMFDRCEVDIDALEYCGYQPEAHVPNGYIAPAGLDGLGIDGTPF